MALPRVCKVRANPPAGAPVIFDFSTPRFAMRSRPRREPVHIEHEMLDFSMKRDPVGFRVFVDLLAFFIPGSAEDAVVCGLGALVMDDTYTFDLTLDANVATPTWRPGYFQQFTTAPMGNDKEMAGWPWQLTALWVCERVLQVGTVGSPANPGQPGNADVAWPTSEANW